MPACRIDPARPHDQIAPAALRDGALAGELAAAIGAEGRWNVVLRIRRVLASVEHIVGRIMDEHGAELTSGLRDFAYGRAVDQRRELFFLLRPVDSRVGRGVDDDIRRGFAKDSRRLGWPGKIASRAVERDHFAERREALP